MWLRIGWIAVIAVFLGPFQAQAQNQVLVLVGGTLIDGTGLVIYFTLAAFILPQLR